MPNRLQETISKADICSPSCLPFTTSGEGRLPAPAAPAPGPHSPSLARPSPLWSCLVLSSDFRPGSSSSRDCDRGCRWRGDPQSSAGLLLPGSFPYTSACLPKLSVRFMLLQLSEQGRELAGGGCLESRHAFLGERLLFSENPAPPPPPPPPLSGVWWTLHLL